MNASLSGIRRDVTYSPKELAAFLSLSPRTLEAWRRERRGPKARTVSRQVVRYGGADVLDWWESLRSPTTR